MEALKRIAKEAGEIDFYKAEKSETDLFYLYGVLAFDYMRAYYYDNPFPEIKEKFDGFCWNYVADMESGAHPGISVSVNNCGNRDAVTLAILDGYILRREEGSLFVTMPAFTKAQKKHFPKHLQQDAGYMCSHMFFSMYRVIIAMAQRNGEIEKPTPNSYCDVLVQYRE